MAGTNRFYTQRLPQYTSQFVQDQTPWQEMIALEQQKIGRSDAALAGAAQAESQFTSLLPGYRTEGAVPGVISDYEKQLQQWQDKHKNSLYSVPAMRELTKIQGRFQSDARVKTIQQDREQNQYYDRFRANTDYRAETDPNLDEEGNIRQLEPGASFSQYETPVYFADPTDEIDEVLKSIKPRSETFSRIKELQHEKYGTLPVIESGRRNVLDESDFGGVREDLVQNLMRADSDAGRYLKAKLGDDYNEEFVRGLIAEREQLRYIDQPISSVSQISGFSQSGKREEENIFVNQNFSLPGEQTMEKLRPPPLEDTDKINILDRHRLRSKERKLDQVDNRVVYEEVIDNPAAMLDPGAYLKTVNREASFKTSVPDKLRDVFVENRAINDFDGTVELFDNHFYDEFNKVGLDITGKSDAYIIKFINDIDDKEIKKQIRKLNADRNYINTKLAKIDKQFDIDGPAFNSYDDALEALNIFADTSNDPEYAWDGFEASDFTEGYNNMSPRQKNQLGKNIKKWQDSEVGKTTWPRVQPFSTKSSDVNSVQSMSKLLIGMQIDTNGKVTAPGGPNGIFMGSAVIRPDKKPEDQLEKDKKAKILPEGAVASVTGIVNPETTGLGPGWLSLTIGEGKKSQQYYMKGSDEFIESQRLPWNLSSFGIPKNAGSGELFAIRGFNNITGQPIILDRWNKQKLGNDEKDVWMNVVYDPSIGDFNLQVYQQNPYLSDERGIRFPYHEKDNKLGFGRIPIPSFNPGEEPDMRTMMQAAINAYTDSQVK